MDQRYDSVRMKNEISAQKIELPRLITTSHTPNIHHADSVSRKDKTLTDQHESMGATVTYKRLVENLAHFKKRLDANFVQ